MCSGLFVVFALTLLCSTLLSSPGCFNHNNSKKQDPQKWWPKKVLSEFPKATHCILYFNSMYFYTCVSAWEGKRFWKNSINESHKPNLRRFAVCNLLQTVLEKKQLLWLWHLLLTVLTGLEREGKNYVVKTSCPQAVGAVLELSGFCKCIFGWNNATTWGVRSIKLLIIKTQVSAT